MKHYEQDGKGLVDSSKSLWSILENAVQDSETGPIIIVLDALDECAEPEFEDLMRNIENRSRNSNGTLRYLMTSRPYQQIVGKFQGLMELFPHIHIPGEEESETISHEVNLVIDHRVRQLAKDELLSKEIETALRDALLEIEHRTYLWVYLVFNYLKSEGFKKTKKGVCSAIKSLPRTVSQAYEKILSKSKDQPIVRKVLTPLLAAARAFTVLELNIATEIQGTTQSWQELDLESEEDFKCRLRSWCGLFVSVYQGKVYFLHQTAREFLIADVSPSTSVPQSAQWEHSIAIQHAHKILAEQCLHYIGFYDSQTRSERDTLVQNRQHHSAHSFFEYSSEFWTMHFQEANLSSGKDAALLQLGCKVSNPKSMCFLKWTRIQQHRYASRHFKDASHLTIVSLFGYNEVVKMLLDKGADVNAQGGFYGNALYAASEQGHNQVVKILLNAGADVNAQGGFYGNALQAASEKGYQQTVKILLNAGADVNAQGGFYTNALQATSINSHEQIVEMLLNAEANASDCVNDRGRFYSSALQEASSQGHDQIAEMLLNAGASFNSYFDYLGQSYSDALELALSRGDDQVVEILLNADAPYEESYDSDSDDS